MNLRIIDGMVYWIENLERPAHHFEFINPNSRTFWNRKTFTVMPKALSLKLSIAIIQNNSPTRSPVCQFKF